MRGRCIDPGATTALEENKEYFLFPNGPKHFYVSRFDNQGAHFGCFQAFHFEVCQEQQQEEKQAELQYFKGRVNVHRRGYFFGAEHIFTSRDKNNYFHVYNSDGKIVGSYLEDFLEVIEPCEPPKQKQTYYQEETKTAENVTKKPINEPKQQENVTKKAKIETSQEKYEQLTLF